VGLFAEIDRLESVQLNGYTRQRDRSLTNITSQSKTARLRAYLTAPGVALAVGAHDALSAKLIEEAGFEAVWASGFGISAVSAVPDANILTMTENLDAVKRMNEAVTIPVIADCDTGYGNAINVLRTVREYESTGAAGMCIEDNVFPKRCSFYAGVRRELVPADEHARKIEAAKSVQRDPNFVVIARTEALIAGWGLDEALERAHAYCRAGADAILIHSKARTFDEIAEFARAWDGSCPLIAVPTTYPDVTTDQLRAAGIKLAILANQPLRAVIPAMRTQLHAMRAAGSAGVVEKDIATLAEVYELVGVSELEESERRYLPSAPATGAIIIAAGFEKELMPLVQDRPKGMLEVRGESILERQVRALRAAGINDISIVRGYRKESINLAGVRYFDNDSYEQTGELESLFRARTAMSGRFVFLYSDILFEPAVLEKLLRTEADIAVVVDRSWPEALRGGVERPLHPDLVITSSPPVDHHRFVSPEGGSTLVRIGQQLTADAAHGEFVGLALFSARGAQVLLDTYAGTVERDQRPFHEAPSVARAAFTDLLQELIDRGHAVQCVDTYKGWIEIDSFEDYRRAWAEVQD